LVAILCVVAETLLTDLFQQITPVHFLGIMYLLGVVLVTCLWGLWPGTATAMVSTIALDYFFIEDLRGIARGLHPALLSPQGLEPAIKALARCSAVPVELTMCADRHMAERSEMTAYHVVSEALTNAARHADTSVLHVDLSVKNAAIWLSIRDDGKGGADPGRGSGLLSITDRVEALGGGLQIMSPAGGGTSLLVEVPITDL
jgi:signal transduction histidine kinase